MSPSFLRTWKINYGPSHSPRIYLSHMLIHETCSWWRHQLETSSALLALWEASDAELWCFLWSAPEQTAEQTIETPVIWDARQLKSVDRASDSQWRHWMQVSGTRIHIPDSTSYEICTRFSLTDACVIRDVIMRSYIMVEINDFCFFSLN